MQLAPNVEINESAHRREIQSHIPEPYWEIKVSYREAGGKNCDFR